MTALLDLAARVEAAEGGDDALDLAIAEWCFGAGAVAGVNYDPQLWLLRNEGFSGSLDAALTLVPEGWRWFVNWKCARCWTVVDDRVVEVEDATAATPALALCAAALRARAAG